jgi:inorganic pyrophosphatase
VEIPKGSALDRPATTVDRTVICPADCCSFPDTLTGRGRPLEAIVCVSQPGARGRRIAVKPVALLRTRHRRGYEDVVLCVPLEDPAWTEVNRVQDLLPHLREEIERFMTTRPSPETETAVVGWCSRDDALTAIDDAAARWAATVDGRG